MEIFCGRPFQPSISWSLVFILWIFMNKSFLNNPSVGYLSYRNMTKKHAIVTLVVDGLTFLWSNFFSPAIDHFSPSGTCFLQILVHCIYLKFKSEPHLRQVAYATSLFGLSVVCWWSSYYLWKCFVHTTWRKMQCFTLDWCLHQWLLYARIGMYCKAIHANSTHFLFSR